MKLAIWRPNFEVIAEVQIKTKPPTIISNLSLKSAGRLAVFVFTSDCFRNSNVTGITTPTQHKHVLLRNTDFLLLLLTTKTITIITRILLTVGSPVIVSIDDDVALVLFFLGGD